jgi:hypothetical protein
LYNSSGGLCIYETKRGNEEADLKKYILKKKTRFNFFGTDDNIRKSNPTSSILVLTVIDSTDGTLHCAKRAHIADRSTVNTAVDLLHVLATGE